MNDDKVAKFSRRGIILGAATSVLFAPGILRAQERPTAYRNVSSFKLHRWQDHFDNIGKGILLSDTRAKILQHWTPGGDMRIYPTSVPMTDELTKRGYTSVVEKRINPGWTPTPSMRERDPSLPAHVPGGAPDNPLGTRALYLSWTYYRIHGTADTRKIGRRSSSGCIGLFNAHIEDVYERATVGTQVKLI